MKGSCIKRRINFNFFMCFFYPMNSSQLKKIQVIVQELKVARFFYLSQSILVYLEVSRAIMIYLNYLWLSLVISGYLRIPLSSIRVQVEAGESKIDLDRPRYKENTIVQNCSNLQPRAPVVQLVIFNLCKL